MTHPEQDELQVLRERAYGPAADIHLDSQALRRLQELEGREKGQEAAPAVDDDETQPEVPPTPAAEAPSPTTDEADSTPDQAHRPPFRVRRSTVLIALALIALIVVSYAALVLVRRVQADPLQAGAAQVARLAEDAAYEIPGIFADMNGQPDETKAYEDFYGLRSIINGNGTDTDDKCIFIYPSESATDSEGSFNGPAFGGCGAGAFPPAAAFKVGPGLPERLRDTFPDGTALQFVLDRAGNEIVVFADR